MWLFLSNIPCDVHLEDDVYLADKRISLAHLRVKLKQNPRAFLPAFTSLVTRLRKHVTGAGEHFHLGLTIIK